MNYQIGCKLKETRKQAGLTLAELAKNTGLSTSYISLLERGLNNPTIENLNRICMALDISMADLISEMSMPESIVMRGEEGNVIFEMEGCTYKTITNGKRYLSGIIITCDNDDIHYSEPHIVDEIGFILDGSMIMNVNGVEYELHKHDSIYIEAGSKHSYQRIGSESCTSLWASTTKINYNPEMIINKNSKQL